MNKKGTFNFKDQWVEFFSLLMFFIAIIVSVFLQSAFFSYIVIAIIGLLIGRFLYLRRSRAPYYIIVFSLVVGYMLGNRYASWQVIAVIFLLSTAASWYAHEEQWIG